MLTFYFLKNETSLMKMSLKKGTSPSMISEELAKL